MANYSEVGGENAELLRAIINDTPYTGEITSRNSAILDSIIKGSAYTDPPQSEIEALLLDLKEKIEGGGSIEVEELNVTENGTYTADIGKAFNPVNVDIASPVLITKNITANGDYSASADNADGYSSVSVNVPLPSNAYLLQTIEHESIATFTDGTDNFLKSLEVAIAPQQDLHGYDSPWVGGAGKNKIPMTVDGIKGANPSATWNGNSTTINGVTFSIQTDGDGNVIGLNANGIASGDSPSLYLARNVALADDSYVLNGCPNNGSLQSYGIFADYSSGGNIPDYGSGGTLNISNVTLNIRIRISNGYTANNLTFKPMIRLASVTDSTFAPYSNICPISGWDECKVTVADDLENPTTSNVYTIDLDGTRYGGKVDLVSGVLTVDRAMVEKTSFVSRVGTRQFGFNISDMKSTAYTVQNAICDRLPYDARSYSSLSYLGFTTRDKDVLVRLPFLENDSLEDANTWCASNPLTFVYELATPIAIQLSPTIIKSLQGENNFFASTGEIELLQYWGKEQN